MLSASCASYRIRRQSDSGTVVFSARPRGDRHCYPPLAMRQACLGRVPRRSSTRFAENLRPETRRFFRLESRRTQPYGRMARDETNQTGKYSVSGTMLPELLCLSLQRHTPCPRCLSDSLRACQKQSFLTRSVLEVHFLIRCTPRAVFLRLVCARRTDDQPEGCFYPPALFRNPYRRYRK